MAGLLERLSSERLRRDAEGEVALRDNVSLERLYRRIQELMLTEHLEILRRAREEPLGREMLERVLERIIIEDEVRVSAVARRGMVQELASRLLGFGPLDQFLKDDTVSEVMVNGCSPVYIERAGSIEKTGVSFESDEQLTEVIRRLVGSTGRRIDLSMPYVDARLTDGSRLNAVLPPLAVLGPALTIRRFPEKPLTPERLVELETLTPAVYTFLNHSVRSRLNCIVSGPTASGKTTMLNLLAGGLERPEERVITLEDAAELRLNHEHRVALETRPPNLEGKGEVTLRDLLRNALRMRPDRIVIGEVRGPEAFDLLQALNTGHDGSLSTVHANSAEDALDRLEGMALMAAEHLPASLIRRQLRSAIDLIVHLHRLADGRRIVEEVVLVGPEGEEPALFTVFQRIHRPSRAEYRRFPLPEWGIRFWTHRGFDPPAPAPDEMMPDA